MSGECDLCGEHALECTCVPISRRRENGPVEIKKWMSIELTEEEREFLVRICVRAKHVYQTNFYKKSQDTEMLLKILDKLKKGVDGEKEKI